MNTIARHIRRTGRLRGGSAALACLFALALAMGPVSGASASIESLSVHPFYFSPARGDSVTFRFTLGDTAEVFLFVVERDSAAVVDTLIAGKTLVDGTVHTAAWRGAYFDGTPAPQDTFLALVRADAGSGVESRYSPFFFIDETPPQVVITLVDPGLIAPGSSDPAQSPDVEITCAVSDPAPGDSLEADVVIYDADGDRVDALPERLVGANGFFKSAWHGSKAKADGLHMIEVTVRDRASYSSRATSYVDVDKDGPTIMVTSPESGAILRELPDSLFGWAWDRTGVKDSLWVEYPERATFLPVASVHVRLDTLFFGIVLRDSIGEEGKLAFRFRAVDRVGQVRIRAYDVTWDESPPPAPILLPLPAVTRAPSVVLDGTVGGSAGDVMRIYRNDALADTLFAKIEGRWPHTLEVVPGLNRIRAVMVDGAGNVSPPSNTVETTFDPSSGLYVPQPFRPGDGFQINFAQPARAVTLRIFDMGGHPVRVIEYTSASDFATIPWNGVNGDGVAVKKGPLVAVVVIEFAAGRKETRREVFLFEP